MSAHCLWLWNDTNKIWVKARCDASGNLLVDMSAINLDDLADVNTSGVADGDFLYYDLATGLWKPKAHASAVDGVHGLGIGAKVRSSADQSIATSTWVTIAFNTEDFDTDTIHDVVTNNSRLTCKTAGKYIFGAIVAFSPNATGLRFSRFIKNGVANWLVGGNIVPNNGVTWGASVFMIVSLALVVNDYVELQGYQDSGSTLNIGANSLFWTQRVG